MNNQAQQHSGFLMSEIGITSPDECLFHVILAGYERSVSYGKGTKNGPMAIIEASQQLELFDGESIPANMGIYTYPELIFEKSCEDALQQIENLVFSILKQKKIPVLLGGEHTISLGAFRALSKLNEPIGIIQFDAHADLRDSYEDNIYSHACVMKRAMDLDFPIAQYGVRSLSYEEHLLRKEGKIYYLDAKTLLGNIIYENMVPEKFPKKIYITLDVDVLDASVMPSTGTPEPGGFSWYDTIRFLMNVMKERTVVGFDVVELAPKPGFHAPDYTVAKLVYSMMQLVR